MLGDENLMFERIWKLRAIVKSHAKSSDVGSKFNRRRFEWAARRGTKLRILHRVAVAKRKAVVIAMRYSGWDGGSVAAGIWIFKKLELECGLLVKGRRALQ